VPADTAFTQDHRTFLSKRVRGFAKIHPEIRELRRILLKLGGEELAPPSGSDPMTNFLIDFGIVFGGPVILKPCGNRKPERILGRMWDRRRHGIIGIGAGYALNADGLWREHLFGVLREGILETVGPKEKYFGLLLIGQAADGFADTVRSANPDGRLA
jgi:hypothetical protein